MEIFIKETNYANSSLISSFLIVTLKKNSFWREFLVEKATI